MQVIERNAKEIIEKGMAYLRLKIISGNYGLACYGLNGQPKFSNDKGHLFSVFHLVNALGRDLNEIERIIFLVRVLSEKLGDQWGYSPRGYYKEEGENPFFTDADDTAFALRILRALNIYQPNDALLKYLSSFQYSGSTQKAFTTFLFNQPGRNLVFNRNFENNAHIHPEVNANVFHALLDTHADKWINFDLVRAAQKDDGSWDSYFYPNAYYATWQFMTLLQKTSRVDDPCFKKGITFLLDAQETNGSWGNDDAYFTALALKTLRLREVVTDALSKGERFLLSCQQEDGSWSTREKIWVFYDYDGDVWQAFDINRIISTSACIDALKEGIKQ